MELLKKTFGLAKQYRPPSGGRKEEYDISFQEFIDNVKKNLPFINKLPNGSKAIILIGLLNSFFQMPLLLLIQGVGGAFLFSLYLLGDIVQHIKMSELFSNASENFKDIICIISGVSIALDIANIFISVLKIMAACSAKENKGSIGSDLYKIGSALIGPIIALGAILGINYFKII